MTTPMSTPRMRFSIYPFIWLAFSGGGVLAAIFALSFRFKARLGLYGRLMDSGIGKVGLFVVLFWLLVVRR